jgi:hypothetical protein
MSYSLSPTRARRGLAEGGEKKSVCFYKGRTFREGRRGHTTSREWSPWIRATTRMGLSMDRSWRRWHTRDLCYSLKILTFCSLLLWKCVFLGISSLIVLECLRRKNISIENFVQLRKLALDKFILPFRFRAISKYLVRSHYFEESQI